MRSAHSLSNPNSGHSNSPFLRCSTSNVPSLTIGKLITNQPSSLDSLPIKSSSCHLVWTTMIALPLPCTRVKTESRNTDSTLSRILALYASSPFLYGSSIMTKRPPLPVIPPVIPTDIMPPRLPLTSNNALLSWEGLMSKFHKSFHKTFAFWRLRSPNFSASSIL